MTIQAATPATRMHSTLVVLVLSMLLGLQPVATDLYLPSLPTIRLELGAGMPQMQLTLTALLLAFGLSQLVWGPLSDRYGRRPLLLLAIGGLGIDFLLHALAPTLAWLFLGRILAGFCGASWVIDNAFIADITAPEERGRAAQQGAQVVEHHGGDERGDPAAGEVIEERQGEGGAVDERERDGGDV